MRSLVISVFYTACALLPLAFGLPLDSMYISYASRRDFLGILGNIDGSYSATTDIPGTITSPSSVEVTRISVVDTTASSKASSITNTAPPQITSATTPSALEQQQSDISSNISHIVPATATSSDLPYTIGDITDASATPPGELTEWKVIGIAVITITFIATSILAVSFFDSWWGFVCAAVCGKSRKMNKLARGLAGETLVPDWEKRSWEFKLANEDGHRYPTLASLESIIKEK